jgi:hypothetical protein
MQLCLYLMDKLSRWLQRSTHFLRPKRNSQHHQEPLLLQHASQSGHATAHDIPDRIAGPAVAAPRESQSKMVFLFGSCCGGQRRSNRPKRERKHRKSRRERKHHLSAASRTPVQHTEVLHVAPLAATSVASGGCPAAGHMLPS